MTRAETPGQLPQNAVEANLSGVIERYCSDCHDKETHKGNLDLETAMAKDVTAEPQIWEKVVRRIRTRQMPPGDKLTPGALGAWQKAEIAKWWPMIKAANVKVD